MDWDGQEIESVVDGSDTRIMRGISVLNFARASFVRPVAPNEIRVLTEWPSSRYVEPIMPAEAARGGGGFNVT
jgi:hypothetical protein